MEALLCMADRRLLPQLLNMSRAIIITRINFVGLGDDNDEYLGRLSKYYYFGMMS